MICEKCETVCVRCGKQAPSYNKVVQIMPLNFPSFSVYADEDEHNKGEFKLGFEKNEFACLTETGNVYYSEIDSDGMFDDPAQTHNFLGYSNSESFSESLQLSLSRYTQRERLKKEKVQP